MPTNPKKSGGSKPVRKRKAPTKTAPAAPSASNKEQEWHEEQVADDLDALRSFDPLFVQCRPYPNVHKWCVEIHHLLLHAQYVGQWSKRYLSTRTTGISEAAAATKLVNACRVIQQDVQEMVFLDADSLLLVQARRRRSRQLGGLSGMDAALSLGRWLNSGFACVGIDARPKPITWTVAYDAPRVNWNGVRINLDTLTRWLSMNLNKDLLGEVRGAARSDLAWLCRQNARDAAGKTGSTAVDVPARRSRPPSYVAACELLLRSGTPKARRTVLDKHGEVKRRCCQILHVLDEQVELEQKAIGGLVKERLRVTLTRSQIGYAVRAMDNLGLLTADPKCRRTELGTRMMKGSLYAVDAPTS